MPPYQIKVSELSNAFAKVLHEWLTPEQMEEVNRLNVTPKYDGCCATHDFCDSNMAMDEAFKLTFGRSFTFYDEEIPETEKQNAADTDLFNAAWDMAKSFKFKIIN